MGKTITIASGKGGTGKTMFAANIGAVLSRRGHSVILVDMDTGLRNLDLYLGLENGVVYDVEDVMNGICRIRQAIIKVDNFPNLSFMAAAPCRRNQEITPLHAKVLCDKLKEKYEYVILDAPAGFDEGFDIAIGGAEAVVLVINPEISSVRDGEMMANILKEKGFEKNVFYVINKINVKMMKMGFAPSLDEVSRGIKQKIIGLIKEDENIHISTNLGIPVVFKEGTYISKNFDKIAARVETNICQ